MEEPAPQATAAAVKANAGAAADQMDVEMEEQQQTANSVNISDAEDQMDPLRCGRPDVVREGDFVILVFSDGRRTFAQCLKHWKGKTAPMKISKRSYSTHALIGLPYGTVLELGHHTLKVLSEGEGLIPEYRSSAAAGAADASAATKEAGDRSNGHNNNNSNNDNNALEDDEARADDSTFPKPSPTTGTTTTTTTAESANQLKDNRNLVDNNQAQTLCQQSLKKLREAGAEGSEIVSALIESSSTFQGKTEFSKAKYIVKKQLKYQQRCRIVRCTAATVCETYFMKNPRVLMNMREDSLGQILSYSNVSAGCQCLVFDTVMGVVACALAQRMGGYGRILSIYTGQQPPFNELAQRFNLSFAEANSVRFVHASDAFNDDKNPYGGDDDHAIEREEAKSAATTDAMEPETEIDAEKEDRERLDWPCPLQEHTRNYILNEMPKEKSRDEFLYKRCARFVRKLTRYSPLESCEGLRSRPCDSLVIVTRFEPTSTLLDLLKYLSPSSPFVIYCEYIEPLTDCFRALQKQSLAINIRLMDTWMREYQMLPGRTHPSMNMSQSGGFILTGIKLCPKTGHNDLDAEVLKELRSTIGGRRGRANGGKRPKKVDDARKQSSSKRRGPDGDSAGGKTNESKRSKT